MELSVLRYLPVILIIIAILGFIWRKWDFFKGVLSDGTPVADKDGKIILGNDGNPIFLGSATRVIAFLFGLCVIMCEVYTTIKTEKFDYAHLIAILVSIGILLGFIKFVDALAVIKGTPTKSND